MLTHKMMTQPFDTLDAAAIDKLKVDLMMAAIAIEALQRSGVADGNKAHMELVAYPQTLVALRREALAEHVRKQKGFWAYARAAGNLAFGLVVFYAAVDGAPRLWKALVTLWG